jgi:hypothetical protein
VPACQHQPVLTHAPRLLQFKRLDPTAPPRPQLLHIKSPEPITLLCTASAGPQHPLLPLGDPPARKVLLVAGPAGVGKSSIISMLLQDFPEQFVHVQLTTTRPSRKAAEAAAGSYRHVDAHTWQRLAGCYEEEEEEVLVLGSSSLRPAGSTAAAGAGAGAGAGAAAGAAAAAAPAASSSSSTAGNLSARSGSSSRPTSAAPSSRGSSRPASGAAAKAVRSAKAAAGAAGSRPASGHTSSAAVSAAAAPAAAAVPPVDPSKATAAAAPSKGKSSSTLAKLKGVQLGVQLELDGWQYGLESAALQAAFDGHKAALVECCDLRLARAVRDQAHKLQVWHADAFVDIIALQRVAWGTAVHGSG